MVLGVIMLEFRSEDILIGMDFLRKFKRSLVIAKGHVTLPDENWIDQMAEILRQAEAKVAKAHEETTVPEKAPPKAGP